MRRRTTRWEAYWSKLTRESLTLSIKNIGRNHSLVTFTKSLSFHLLLVYGRRWQRRRTCASVTSPMHTRFTSYVSLRWHATLPLVTITATTTTIIFYYTTLLLLLLLLPLLPQIAFDSPQGRAVVAPSSASSTNGAVGVDRRVSREGGRGTP